jgi:aminopeptidase N
MKSTLIVAFIILRAINPVMAQEDRQSWQCSTQKHGAQKETIASPAEENYDVKYVKLNLNVTNLSKALSGDATTKAITTISAFSAYVFELDSVMTIDSVFANGIFRPFTRSGPLCTVILPAPLPANTLFTVQVFYHGTPRTSATIFDAIGGYNNIVSPSWATRVTFTQSESYHAFEWWPCKQSLHDKIDSTDIWITVANNLKAGSNGMLKAVTTIDTGYKRYEWKEKFPIDYYLISLAVAPYIDYSYYMHYTGSTDSTLVQNFVYNNPATLPIFKSTIDSTGFMIDYFSTLYGRYPFWREKYGHCMAPLNGGMEHQTMTTLGYFEGTIVAHELAHQWFGDNVTCGTWADIVMNEGFAAYAEALFIEHFRSHALMLQDMVQRQTDVTSVDTGTIYCPDTANEGRVFDSRLTYNKGACLLHMLRSVINNDSLYFQVYKSYQARFKDSTATIADFKNTAEGMLSTTVNGINLDTFFNQWAYQQGFPKYTITWNQVGGEVYVKLVQNTAVPTSVSMFTLPVELQFHSATGDTLVRVNNTQASQSFHFTWSRTMSALSFDPNFWLVYKLNNISKDPSLQVVGVNEAVMPAITIAPNPATGSWHIASLPANSALTLTDMSGHQLWQIQNLNTDVDVPASKLAGGLYLLQITNAVSGSSVYKLVKE